MMQTMQTDNYGNKYSHIQCPYNVCHIEPMADFPEHLIRCRKEYEKKCDLEGKAKKLHICKFNDNHKVYTIEIKFHEKWCENRSNMEAEETVRGGKEHGGSKNSQYCRGSEKSQRVPYRLIPIQLQKQGPVLIKDYGHGLANAMKNTMDRSQAAPVDPRLVYVESRGETKDARIGSTRVRDQIDGKKVSYREYTEVAVGGESQKKTKKGQNRDLSLVKGPVNVSTDHHRDYILVEGKKGSNLDYTEVAVSGKSQGKTKEAQNQDLSVVEDQKEVNTDHHRDFILVGDQSEGKKDSNRDLSLIEGQGEVNTDHRQDYIFIRRQRKGRKDSYRGYAVVKGQGEVSDDPHQYYGIKRKSGGQYPRRESNNKCQNTFETHGNHPLAFNHGELNETPVVPSKKSKRSKQTMYDNGDQENIWGDAAEDWDAEAKAIEEKEADKLQELDEPELIPSYQTWSPPRRKSDEKQFQYKPRFDDSGLGSEGDVDLDLPVEMETSCYARNLEYGEDWNDYWLDCAPSSSPPTQQFQYDVMVLEKEAPPPRVEVTPEELEKEEGECSEEEFDEFIGEDPFSGI